MVAVFATEFVALLIVPVHFVADLCSLLLLLLILMLILRSTGDADCGGFVLNMDLSALFSANEIRMILD